MQIPTICVEYQKHLTREAPQNVTFITSTDCFFDINVVTFVDVKNQVFVFEKMNYVGNFAFEWGKHLAVMNGYGLCVDENRELFIAGIIYRFSVAF